MHVEQIWDTGIIIHGTEKNLRDIADDMGRINSFIIIVFALENFWYLITRVAPLKLAGSLGNFYGGVFFPRPCGKKDM